MNRLFLGVDPGASGGIAVLERLSGCVVTDTESLGNLSEKAIWDCIGIYRDAEAFAVIEKVPTAIFGVGKSSCSKLYGSFCQLRAFLVAAGIPFEEVPAVKWQKEMGIPKRKKNETKTKWKNRLKSHAERLFPRTKVTLSICDALLIAEYARRKHS